MVGKLCIDGRIRELCAGRVYGQADEEKIAQSVKGIAAVIDGLSEREARVALKIARELLRDYCLFETE